MLINYQVVKTLNLFLSINLIAKQDKIIANPFANPLLRPVLPKSTPIFMITQRLILYPFTRKTAMQSEKMKEVQPQLEKLEKKYNPFANPLLRPVLPKSTPIFMITQASGFTNTVVHSPSYNYPKFSYVNRMY